MGTEQDQHSTKSVEMEHICEIRTNNVDATVLERLIRNGAYHNVKHVYVLKYIKRAKRERTRAVKSENQIKKSEKNTHTHISLALTWTKQVDIECYALLGDKIKYLVVIINN